MTKTYCDICGKEGTIFKRNIVTEFAASAWQRKEMDVCPDCCEKLMNLLCSVEAQFLKKKGDFGLKFD